MKFVLEGDAQSKAFVIGMITEDKMKNLTELNKEIIQYGVKVDKIETVNGQKIIHIVAV